MLKSITRLFGGDPIGQELERYQEIVERINGLEKRFRELDDRALKAQTPDFKSRLASGATLDDLLPEAFAVVREAAMRTVGLRHFDVQLIGGVALHEGRIAEMKTGEGKTLVATMPIYLNALTDKGAHLVTVNDYLARRDARWMGPVFDFLGLSVGVLQEASRTEHGRKAFVYDPSQESSQEDVHQLVLVDRHQAYQADVTYGTNNEFGFDYLRDNMAQTLEARSQRGHHYAILDEVDNILIDEARTPLIISGPSHEEPELYEQMARVVKQLAPEDFEVSERDRTISLTELGEDHAEQLIGTPLRDPDRPEDITPEQARLLGYLEQSLRAEYLFKRNKDYVVQGGKVIIVDEFTGRMMAGRRWSDGLHQAVEAKEGVKIREENVTYATITLQNYFRMYEKLAGMTGTALTEAEEFNKIYKVEVLPLPTNLEYIAMQPDTDLVEVEYRENGHKFEYYARPDDPEATAVFWRRKDYQDEVYRTEEAKLRAVTMEILRRHAAGQPMLVGTTSVELSEKLSERLKAETLQRLAMIQILRDAYMEAHEIPDDGRRVEELQQLYGPLESLSTALVRPFARELELPMNPVKPENLTRLASLLALEEQHHDRLTQALQSGIQHNVLNAKKHTEESQIIASAGAFGAVTIATNMAGRGVDIKLGGELPEEILAAVNRVLRRGEADDLESVNLEERLAALSQVDQETIGIYDREIAQFRKFMEEEKLVRQVGGLHVLGSERHDARRIDNQLRGRAARQGDPGSSQFFLSLEDELMRLFGGAQVSGLMERLNIDDAMPIAHGIVNRTIEQSQSRVEGANFDRRKHLLEYDDVLNQQREIFYGQRNRVFVKEGLSEDIDQMVRVEVDAHVNVAVEDPEGPWRLLAWLEEIQPTLGLETERPHPSFMLTLLLDWLEDKDQSDQVKAALLELVDGSLEAQSAYTRTAIEAQLERTLTTLEDQVKQRVELADMAIEGTLLEAEQTGDPPDANALLGAVESAAGLRLQVDGQLRDLIREDPDDFRDAVPELIEDSLGLRVWNGLTQSLERRVGQALELQVETPIDWDAAEALLFESLAQTEQERRERVRQEVERELDQLLPTGQSVDANTKLRTLVQISYSKQRMFDARTHQAREVLLPRLSYAHFTAGMLTDLEAEQLSERILAHLESAKRAIQRALGEAELHKTGLRALDEKLKANLRSSLGSEAYQEALSADRLSEGMRQRIEMTIGASILREVHRRVLLGVGDRLWVDYLTEMEALRTSIGLEAYGQRDPLVQYKSRAVDMFQNLLASIRSGVVNRAFRLQAAAPQRVVRPSPPKGAQRSRSSGDGKPPSANNKPRKRRRRRRRR